MGKQHCMKAKRGWGLVTKVQHSTSATKFGGLSAAIEIAMGPEKDSPSKKRLRLQANACGLALPIGDSQGIGLWIGNHTGLEA